MELPNLYGVVKEADVKTKGDGRFKASYVTWAKTQALLLEHAPGYHFHLKNNSEGNPWFQAPDGSAYLVGFFTTPEGDETAGTPFAVMDHKNNPIQLAKVSARILTDSSRRCLCLCAAMTFGLCGELWANDPIEGDYKNNAETTSASKKKTLSPVKGVGSTSVCEETDESDPDAPLSTDERNGLLEKLSELQKTERDVFKALLLEFATKFDTGAKPVSGAIQLRKHADFLATAGIRYDA